tara:strand:- start:161 stop:397 length:237 start_codon:yes stop_codon:yes gene_type:complete
MNKKKEYINGYRDKVEYWSDKLHQATSEHSPHTSEDVLKIMEKLEYFSKKHAEWLKPTKKKKIIEQLDLGNGNIIYGV